MDFQIGYLLALVVIGLSVLGFALAMMLDEINRKKGAVVFILSVILLLLGCYYYFVVGQEQEAVHGPSRNLLNHYLSIYRIPSETGTEIPPGPRR